MKKVYIIAEAGVNHNGNLDLAKQLIDAAAKAGADAVKFQSFKADNLCTSKAPKADYQIIHDTQSTSQLDMLRRLELSLDDQMILYHYAIKKGLDFLSTPFDIESAQFLNTLNLKSPREKLPITLTLEKLPLIKNLLYSLLECVRSMTLKQQSQLFNHLEHL